MWIKNFMACYKGEIGIGDGVRCTATKAKTIICREGNGDAKIIKTGLWQGKTTIREWKYISKGKIDDWMRFGAWQRFMTKHGMAVMRFHKDSLTRMHGITERPDQKFMGNYGMCKTRYSWGKFMHQDFWYPGGHRRAYSFHHTDKTVIFKHKNGIKAGEVNCPGGFKTRGSDGECVFEAEYVRRGHYDYPADKFNFSKDGNCSFTFYDKTGRITNRGEYRNSQRVGEWILGAKPVYFIHGVAIAKKLWDTPPEKIKISTILRIKNAQMRAALMSKIGQDKIAQRMVQECKYKLIHRTKNGMCLMEFPFQLEEHRGRENQRMRILQVTCPSTKTKYYLNVPNYFVRNGERVTNGKRISLNNCEAARQWTMLNDNPKKRIKFAKET